jgi:serine protease Do
MQKYPWSAINTLLTICLVITSSPSFAEVSSSHVARTSDAVVLIKAHLKHGLLEDDDAEGRWSGSGFLINSEKGWIVTNAHVSGYGPTDLRVRFEDQREFTKAERIFVDSKHDIAVIKIDSDLVKDREALNLDCDYEFKRGDKIFSVGHPKSQYFTLSTGVLSGIKDFHIDGHYFTTDTVVESGSSGGPAVLSDTGKVIGMMSAGFDSSDLGFLTTSHDICRITDLLAQGKNPARPRFKFQTMVVDSELSNIVGAVFHPSITLQPGDEILSWNGNLWHPESDGDLADAMRGYDGDRVSLSVLRDGVEELMEVPISQGRSIHETEWVFFSGLMITEDDKKDSSFLNGNNPKPILLIESIDTDYDDTSDIEFDSGSEIFSVDLKEGLTLRDLYQYLLTIPASERVKIVARVYDWTPEVYSVWMQYAFPVVQLDCSWCDA